MLPRVLEIKYTEKRGFYTNTRVPSICHTSRESRKEVLKHYCTAFGAPVYKPKMLVNYRLDVVYLPYELVDDIPFLLCSFKDRELHNLRHLGLYRMDLDELRERFAYECLKKTVQSLEGLEELLTIEDITVYVENDLNCVPDLETSAAHKFVTRRGRSRSTYYLSRLPSFLKDLYGDIEDDLGFQGGKISLHAYFSRWKVPKQDGMVYWDACEELYMQYPARSEGVKYMLTMLQQSLIARSFTPKTRRSLQLWFDHLVVDVRDGDDDVDMYLGMLIKKVVCEQAIYIYISGSLYKYGAYARDP
jgi:hypothetical protein